MRTALAAAAGASVLAATGIALAFATDPERARGIVASSVPLDRSLERVWAQRQLADHLFTRPDESGETYHEVPIVAANVTAWSPPMHRDRSTWAAALGRIRTMCRESGNDVDPRAFWGLIAEECFADGHACHHFNVGNVKANWSIRATRAQWDARRVRVPVPECKRVYALTDRVGSTDLYFGYNSFADACRHWFRSPSRRGALAGYRRGGLDGLVEAETALAHANYSPATAAVRVTRAVRWWNLGERMLGTAWVR